jgi:phospholipase C
MLEAPWKFKRFQHFLDDAQKGTLPNYSFIEPRYFPDPFDQAVPNDQHPPHNMVYGEQLIAAVYNAVRGSSCWKKSLLIVTYDEHGGCFDHAPPPLAVPPDAHRQDGFAFDRYGVRVPAVVISPYCPPGARIRNAPSGLQHDQPPYPFDHTSIISTLRDLFELGDKLTNRDLHAPTLTGALSLAAPSNDGPSSVTAPEYGPSPLELTNRSLAPANGMQAVLAAMGRKLSQQAAATPAAVVPAPAVPVPLEVDKVGSLDAVTARQHAVAGFEALLKQPGATG